MSDTDPEFAGPGEWKAQSEPGEAEGEFRGPGDWKSQANQVEAPNSVWDMEDE